jgi:hypothetical protein
MRSHRTVLLTVLLSFSPLLLARPAYADRDGCYCTSKGYIAFELRSFRTPGLHAPHILKVFRFESGRGIYEAGEAPMEDFQVHEMICDSDHVEIAGFGKGYVKYVIAIDGESNKPRITQHIQVANRHFDPSKEGTAPGELGLSKPGVIPLESSDAEHKYQLVLTLSRRQVKEGVETIRKAELRQVDLRETVSQRVLLYEDRYTYGGGE